MSQSSPEFVAIGCMKCRKKRHRSPTPHPRTNKRGKFVPPTPPNSPELNRVIADRNGLD